MVVHHPSWKVDNRTFQRAAHGEGRVVLGGSLVDRMDGRNGMPYVDVMVGTQDQTNMETYIFDLTVEVLLDEVRLVEVLREVRPSVVVVLLATCDQAIQ